VAICSRWQLTFGARPFPGVWSAKRSPLAAKRIIFGARVAPGNGVREVTGRLDGKPYLTGLR
jgi:hypothetical protein